MASSNAYDLRLFEPNTAPRRAPRREPERRPKPKIVKRPAPTAAQLRAQQRAAFRQTVKVLSLSALVLVLFAARLYGSARLDEVNHQVADLEDQLSIVTSENTRLNMELKSKVSLERVDEYATNVLDMVKRGSYQIEYVDLSAADGVVVANGEQTGNSAQQENSSSFFEKIKAYLS